MSTTTSDEVSARVVNVAHYDADTDTLTVLALVEHESLSIEFEEEDADFAPSTETRNRRIPAGEQVTVSIASAIAIDNAALEQLGVVDANGNYQRDAARVWDDLVIEYLDEESGTPVTQQNFKDVRWNIASINTEQPASFEAEGMVEGAIDLDWSRPA